MSDVFKALADPTRRAILLRVAETPQAVNALAEQFQMTRPAVSKHIRTLERVGLLRLEAGTKDGRQRICYAQLEAARELRDYLSQLAAFWDGKLEGLGDFLAGEE